MAPEPPAEAPITAVLAAAPGEAVDVALRSAAADLGASTVMVAAEGGPERAHPAALPATEPDVLDAVDDGATLTQGDGTVLHAVVRPLDDGERLVLLRPAGPLDDADQARLAVHTAAVATALRLSRAAGRERRLRDTAERRGREHEALRASLEERNRLLSRLARIQRSISHRAPLQEVFDAITSGASELLGIAAVGLRIVDPEDPERLVMISSHGLGQKELDDLQGAPRTLGLGGRAIAENRLVVQYDYAAAPHAHRIFVDQQMQSALAAPVHDHQRVVGSLAVGTFERGRRFSAHEQEALLALAEHASIAMTDARTVAALREAQHAKDLFLAMVSHELKTPLTVIMGTLRTLERRADKVRPELRTAMLGTAFERGRDLERLIDRLLRGARAELASSPEAIGLPVLVARAVEGFDAGRTLRRSAVPEVTLVTDVAAVRDIVGMLLENAESHAPPDTPIDVDVSLTDGEVRMAVRNAGALPEGLEPQELFTPFLRGPRATSSGVGLGLSIAWRLATAMGGRIDIDSGGGEVTFVLVFPYLPASPPAADPAVAPSMGERTA